MHEVSLLKFSVNLNKTLSERRNGPTTQLVIQHAGKTHVALTGQVRFQPPPPTPCCGVNAFPCVGLEASGHVLMCHSEYSGSLVQCEDNLMVVIPSFSCLIDALK